MKAPSTEGWFRALPGGRARTPLVGQMEAAECGATALAIILAHFGRTVPRAALRRDCGVSRDGANAANILKAARSHGLRAAAHRRDLAGLRDIRGPYILYWNFNHFVVVEGYARNGIWLNDPASGHRRCSPAEFEAAFTGIVLVFEPGPEFQREHIETGLTAALRKRVQGSGGALAMCICAAMLQVVPGILVPALVQAFVDRVMLRGSRDWGALIVAGILSTAAVAVSLTRLRNGLLRRLQRRLATVFSSRFVWHLLHLPVSYYAQRFAGELSGRIALNDSVAELLSGRLATAGIEILAMAAYLFAMFRFGGVLAWAGLFFAGLQLALLWWSGKTRFEMNTQTAFLAARTGGFELSGLQAMSTIKASALEPEFFERWSGYFANLMGVRQRTDQANQVFAVSLALTSAATNLLVLALGALRVFEGALSAGQLVAFQLLLNSFLRPVNSLVSLGSDIRMLQSDLIRLDDVLENPQEEEHVTLANSPHSWAGSWRLTGRVEIRSVSFGYHALEAPLITGLSVTIRAGERVALVGATGSGKSTIARLVAGLHRPSSGEILLDGHQRSAIPREVLTNSLSLVDQEAWIFEGTVFENVTLWDDTLSKEAVIEACKDALLHDFISQLPQGYETRLSERAANLSGGQRQRLELARALVSRPSILILDEATSALDPELEGLVERNLRRRGCSCLIVTHRLDAIRDCDEIIVLDQGSVVERGRHEDLLRAQGAYVRLLASEVPAERLN